MTDHTVSAQAAVWMQTLRQEDKRFAKFNAVELDVAEEIAKDYLKLGYEPCTLLADIVYYALEIRIAQETDEFDGKEVKDKIALRITLEKQLLTLRTKGKEEKDIEDEITDNLRAAEMYLIERMNGIGFSVGGKLVDVRGMPYLGAILVDEKLLVWNDKLWRLVETGEVSIWHMAYVLQCSVEGLVRTAGEMGKTVPGFILATQEDKLKAYLVADADDKPMWLGKGINIEQTELVSNGVYTARPDNYQ